MYKKGDYIVYKKDVCKIKDIVKNHFNNVDYYILNSVGDSSLKIEIPTDNGFIRNIITKDEANNLIKEIPNISVIEDNKLMEHSYKELLKNATHEDLIKIIKTTSKRNKERLDNKKTKSDTDDTYFNIAENYLYNELMISLNLSYEDTKEYVVNKINELAK